MIRQQFHRIDNAALEQRSDEVRDPERRVIDILPVKYGVPQQLANQLVGATEDETAHNVELVVCIVESAIKSLRIDHEREIAIFKKPKPDTGEVRQLTAEVRQALSNRLTTIMAVGGYTNLGLAGMAGVSDSTVSVMRTGTGTIGTRGTTLIVQALGYDSIDEFLEGGN